MPHSTLVSRADLLVCLQAHGAEHTAAWAQALGYTPQDPQPPTPASAEPASAPGAAAPARQVAAVPREQAQLRLPRIVHHETLAIVPGASEEPEWYKEERPWPENDPALSANPHARPLPQLPLMPWSRLWPFLKAVLSVRLESAQLDVSPLVERLARGEMPQRLPRRTHQSWAGTCQVLIDFADPLTPFWDDFHWLLQRLMPLRGEQGLTVLAFPEGNPAGRCLEWSPAQEEWREREAYTLPVAGTPVLVLSDLGCNDATGARRRPWQWLGQRLRRVGCQPVALMPCPPRCWVGEVTQLFAPVYWDREARRPYRPRPSRGQPVGRSPQAYEADAEALLQALGAAVRVEPALLRAVRYRLPGADVGSEAAAWNHPHMYATPLGMYYEPEQVAAYRQAFAQLEPSLRQAVAGLLRDYHAHLSPVIAHEEQRLLETSGSVPPDKDTATFQARLVRNLRDQKGAFVDAVQALVKRMTRRQYAAFWHAERLTALWVATHLAQIQAGETLTVPEGLDIDKARWLLTGHAAPQRYTVRQRGTSLYVETEPPASVLDAPGSPLGHLDTVWPSVRVQSPDGPEFLHPIAQGLLLPPEGAVRLRTEHQQVRIESQTRPVWASGMGQDQHGLFVLWEARQRKAYWVPPGVYPVTDNTGQTLGQRHLGSGFWCDAQEAVELLQHGFRQPPWSEEYGVDGYGLYAVWRVQGVTQRMRWIAPGEFQMGSPADEPDRLDNETLHAVLLTRGFWLAETTCTQALWRAVTGDNPSRSSVGDEYPVESVSWNDVQAFLQRLNALVPEGGFRLPTEAEWEYACRAGTTTPFWFGQQITREQVNYDSSTTVPVEALPRNGWGLYQMHGNVLEWCQDGYGPYAAVAADIAAVDPTGAAAGGIRVARGGGWILDARFARAARRFALRPGYRGHDLGFRLARGQASPVGEAPEAQGKSGTRRAGQTARSRVGQARRAPRQRSQT